MELVLSHDELTEVGRRVLKRGGPVSIYLLNAAALQRVFEREFAKVFIRFDDGEKKQLVMSRIN